MRDAVREGEGEGEEEGGRGGRGMGMGRGGEGEGGRGGGGRWVICRCYVKSGRVGGCAMTTVLKIKPC